MEKEPIGPLRRKERGIDISTECQENRQQVGTKSSSLLNKKGGIHDTTYGQESQQELPLSGESALFKLIKKWRRQLVFRANLRSFPIDMENACKVR